MDNDVKHHRIKQLVNHKNIEKKAIVNWNNLWKSQNELKRKTMFQD